LAAVRSFFSFVAQHEPRVALQCAEVLRVPFKKATRRATRYLESAEVSAILSQPDRSTVEGQRDHALMSLLYNTGARVQEALDLRPQDIYFKSPAHDTTNHYAQANLETKRKALEQVNPKLRPGKPPRCKRDADL
jgi:site-specific recombinase XerD